MVTKLDGIVTYHIQLEDGRDIRRHADQLRTRVRISGSMEADMDFPNTNTDLPNAESNQVAAGTRDQPAEAVVDTTTAPTPP